MIKVGDMVQNKDTHKKMRVVEIHLLGKGFREYDCTFSDKDNEHCKVRLPIYNIKELDKKHSKFGF